MRYSTRYPFTKVGKCKICQNNCEFSGDHVPPKSCGNEGRFQLAPEYAKANKQKGVFFQNGIQFYSICSTCNNQVGAEYDPALASFVNQISQFVGSRLLLPNIIRAKINPDRVMRSLAAHYLATSPFHKDSKNDVVFRDFLQLKLTHPSIMVNVAIYPHKDTVIIKDNAKGIWTKSGFKTTIFSMIKFFPLAFMFTETKDEFGWENLNRYMESADTLGFSEFAISKRIVCHPQWPEHPNDSEFNLFDSDRNPPIRAIPQ